MYHASGQMDRRDEACSNLLKLAGSPNMNLQGHLICFFFFNTVHYVLRILRSFS